MRYNQVVKGQFIDRPNRFIAHVEINGTVEVCHVKNTGRCRELLVPGCTVYCAKSDNPSRKTLFDLIAVEKSCPAAQKGALSNVALKSAKRETSQKVLTAAKDTSVIEQSRTLLTNQNKTLLINMDSQAPNAAAKEWLETKSLFAGLSYLKPEYKHGNSRFDFYLEEGPRKIFLEVKGVTLEENGVAAFPDAPTERGIKHLHELAHSVSEGYAAYVLFVVQMEDAEYFTPNRKTHPAFAEALLAAQQAGVHLLAYTCKVTPDSMVIHKPLPIHL